LSPQEGVLLVCDLEKYGAVARIYGKDKEKRGLVVYVLLQTGFLTN
jgi:hypothetical protein